MRGLLFILGMLILFSCREKYLVDLPPVQTDLLVVEGFINPSGVSAIQLSRTTPLATRTTVFERNAEVVIEDDLQTSYPLVEADSGRYVSSMLTLDSDRQYRVNIKTNNNKRYVSTFSKPIITPEIDSITWMRYDGGLEIYVDSRDPLNMTKYYRWEYDEVWEFHSAYEPRLDLLYNETPSGLQNVRIGYIDTVSFGVVDTMYRCWKSRASTGIIIGNTERLSTARAYAPIIFYPRRAWELSVLYSVLVRQYGLSKEGYEFYNKLKRNTESLGSIFDAQPSEMKGNLKNVDDEKEIVVGHVEVCSVTEKRKFISNQELPDWNYFHECEPEFQINLFNTDSLIRAFYKSLYLPTMFKTDGIVGAAEKECVDCRLRGTNIKPPFWP